MALLLCTQAWAGDDPKIKDKTAKKAETEIKSETGWLVVSGDYAGMISIGGYHGIQCRHNPEAICFLVNNIPTLIVIPSTNEEIEVTGYIGSSTQGDVTTYFYSVP